MLAGEGAELFDIVLRMDGLGTFAEELKNCVEISIGGQKLKVLSLERILASKLAANRAKDKLTIPSCATPWPRLNRSSAGQRRSRATPFSPPPGAPCTPDVGSAAPGHGRHNRRVTANGSLMSSTKRLPPGTPTDVLPSATALKLIRWGSD